MLLIFRDTSVWRRGFPRPKEPTVITKPTLDEYSFVKNIPQDYICTICTTLLKDPHVTECCGQHFCIVCLKTWFTKNKTKQCPHCRTADCYYIRYLPMKRDIDELEVYCTNKDHGCTHIVKLGEVYEHVNKVCEYSEVKCPAMCGSNLFRKDLKRHNERECPNREAYCKYCHSAGTYRQINSHAHQEICPDFPLSCPKNCGASGIKRKNMDNHRKKCPLEPVECQFAKAGCKQKLLSRDLERHMQRSTQEHLLFLNDSFTKLSAQLTNQHEASTVLQRKHDELQRSHTELKKKHDELQRKLNADNKKATPKLSMAKVRRGSRGSWSSRRGLRYK